MSLKTSDYLYIERWAHYLGSLPYYVIDQLRLARRDLAPCTAIYKDQAGVWVSIEDVTDNGTRHFFTARGWMTPDWRIPADDRRIMADVAQRVRLAEHDAKRSAS